MPLADSVARLPAGAPERFMTELGLSLTDRWAIASMHRISEAAAELSVLSARSEGADVLRAVVMLAPGQWPDALESFHVRWVGLLLDEERDRAPEYPHLWLPSLGLVLQAWQRVAAAPSAKVYAEARWHPARGEERALKWTDTTATNADRELAVRGLQLIADLERTQGKKPGDGTTYRDRRHFVDAVCKAITELTSLRKRDPRTLNARDVYRRMGIGKTTFYDYLQAATGQRWAEFIRNYAEFGGLVPIDNG